MSVLKATFVDSLSLNNPNGLNGYPLVEWWYNTSYHMTFKMTPSKEIYGYPPTILDTYVPSIPKAQ
jgi:hypothetical protein